MGEMVSAGGLDHEVKDELSLFDEGLSGSVGIRCAEWTST